MAGVEMRSSCQKCVRYFLREYGEEPRDFGVTMGLIVRRASVRSWRAVGWAEARMVEVARV